MSGLYKSCRYVIKNRHIFCTFFRRHIYQVKNKNVFRLSASIVNENDVVNNYRFYCSSTRLGLTSPLFLQAYTYLDRIAIIDSHGVHRYGEILSRANALADRIQYALNSRDKAAAEDVQICIICRSNVSYVVSLFATWICGAVAVPLSPKYPAEQLEYFFTDSQASLVITGDDASDDVTQAAQTVRVPLLKITDTDYARDVQDKQISSPTSPRDAEWAQRWNRLMQLRDTNKYARRSALIVYTSGTTGRPKGALHTHGSLHAQMSDMATAWSWTSSDVVLHCLPLYHVHGIINVLMTPLYVGAACVMLEKFDAREVWTKLLSPLNGKGEDVKEDGPPMPRSVNVFSAVPTIYSKLIEYHDTQLSSKTKDYVRATCMSKIRLFMSGSAALPLPVLERWEEITGHRLLERYGMTELGMALTNPLVGNRVPGAVGRPFPHVEVRIVRVETKARDEYNVIVQSDSRSSEGRENEEGDLQVRGATLFKCYWKKEKETKESFTSDGWFKTGDTAVYRKDAYSILGRTSVDIIKSGGYKISALEIEQILLAHPDVSEIAIVGVPDITWGQVVAAVIVPRPGAALTLKQLKEWSKKHLPPYQVPTVVRLVEDIPRNAMGKVNKKQLVASVFSKEASAVAPKKKS